MHLGRSSKTELWEATTVLCRIITLVIEISLCWLWVAVRPHRHYVYSPLSSFVGKPLSKWCHIEIGFRDLKDGQQLAGFREKVASGHEAGGMQPKEAERRLWFLNHFHWQTKHSVLCFDVGNFINLNNFISHVWSLNIRYSMKKHMLFYNKEQTNCALRRVSVGFIVFDSIFELTLFICCVWPFLDGTAHWAEGEPPDESKSLQHDDPHGALLSNSAVF